MQWIFLAMIICGAFFLFEKFARKYQAKREQQLADVLGGFADVQSIRSPSASRPYRVIYRDKKGEIQSYATDATNELEAQYNCIKNTDANSLRILEVKTSSRMHL